MAGSPHDAELDERDRRWEDFDPVDYAKEQRARAEAAEARAAELEAALRGLVACGVTLCAFCEEEPAMWWREASAPFSELVCDDCRQRSQVERDEDYPDPLPEVDAIRAALAALDPPSD